MTVQDRNVLIVNRMELADKIAKNQYRRMGVRSVDLDELRSAAYMGLVDAANRFRGGDFDTFASYRIYGEIKDYLRTLCWGSRSNRLNRLSLEGLPEGATEDVQHDDSIDVLTGDLPERSRDVVLMYYVEDCTLGDIADKLEVSQTRVHQILTKSVKQLRDWWAGRESEFCDE
jgi:RNA polymerase sigma factor (sigma-70 family)